MKVIFNIDLKGQVTSEVLGGDGKNCLEATAPYEQALGDPDPDRQMKPEGSLIRPAQTVTRNQIQA